MYYHASQIVHVVDPYQQHDVKHLTSCARLSVSVNKKCVFAYLQDDNETVTYQTLQWDNPKVKQVELSQAESQEDREGQEAASWQSTEESYDQIKVHSPKEHLSIHQSSPLHKTQLLS